jgi:hypothetical protein
MKRSLLLILAMAFFIGGCSVLQTLTNISRLKFKLDNVNNFTVNGIAISNKSKISDFGTFDIINLTTLLASGKMPVSFIVNVAAKNPNDGQGGTRASDVTLKSFEWDLYLNDKKTISGNISKPLVVPGVGEQTIIPLQIDLDLFQFFGDGGLNEILNLALKLGGKSSSPTNVKLVAQPVLGTMIGDLRYPEPLTIVSTTFN